MTIDFPPFLSPESEAEIRAGMISYAKALVSCEVLAKIKVHNDSAKLMIEVGASPESELQFLAEVERLKELYDLWCNFKD